MFAHRMITWPDTRQNGNETWAVEQYLIEEDKKKVVVVEEEEEEEGEEEETEERYFSFLKSFFSEATLLPNVTQGRGLKWV